MISKLIVHGKDRTEAIEKMIRAIEDYKIVGVETTLDFCKFVLRHQAFVSGKFDTGFIGKYFKPEMLLSKDNGLEELAAIAGALAFGTGKKTNVLTDSGAVKKSKWKTNRLN